MRFETKLTTNLPVFGDGFFIIIFLVFFVLILRLFQLTVVKGNYYYRLSEENRVKELIIEAQRGKIVDRKGLVLVKNLPADVRQNQERLISKRIYQSSESTTPLVGYQQLADKNDLANDHCLTKLKLGDKTGKKGIEQLYDCDLRGQPGKKLIEVDAKNKPLKTLTVIPPIEGKTIQLAADLELQQKAYQLLEGKKGAVVGLKPKTGEIFILLSSPSYHPNKVDQVVADKDQPLFNRATEGVYPPGSIFKLVIAVAALEEGVIDEKTEIEDSGVLQAGPLSFGNWYFLQYGKTDGMVDIVKAIRRSNDIFFYKTGEKVGPEKIKVWAEVFGYGHQSGFGLDESDGLIPSPFWKLETLGDQWYTGDTYNFSIGQGYLLVTPLQVTIATAAIANDGYLCKPQLLKIRSRLNRDEIRNCKKLPISKKTLSLIQQGMKQACSPGGTGWPLFNFQVSAVGATHESPDKTASSGAVMKPIQTACKTGTAESLTKETAPHAWFTAYAPFENPEIVLTVLLEEAGQGSDVAGPIVKEILKAYFERKE